MKINKSHSVARRTAFVLFVTAVFSSCLVFGQSSLTPDVVPTSSYAARANAVMPSANVIVFPFWSVDECLFRGSDALKATSLNNQELQQLDSLLVVLHRANNLPIAGYYHQFISAIDIKGHKLVYVNGFCRVDSSEWWKTHLYQVKGGGACYYDVVVSLSTGQYSNFRIDAPK